MKKIRIGLAGCGIYGTNLLRFLNRMQDRYEVSALMDIDSAVLHSAAALLDSKPELYTNFSDFLENRDLEAVIIATPNSVHTEQALAVMEKGLFLYLEKPVACTFADCRKIAKKQQELNANVMIGMQLRYGNVFSKAKELLEAGSIGPVRLIWYREFRSPFFPGSNGWRLHEETSGGTIVEKNVHHLDLFNWYIDSEPVSVFASGGADAVYQGGNMLDNAVVTIEYASGARACLGLSLFSAGCDQDLDFYIVGDEGVMYIFSDHITIKPNSGDTEEIVYAVKQELAELGHGGTEYSALSAFYEFITEGRKPYTGIREGILSVGMALCAQESIKEKRMVLLEEVLGKEEDRQ